MVSLRSQDGPHVCGSDDFGELVVQRPITVTLAFALLLGVLVPVCAIVVAMYRTTTQGTDQIAQTAQEELAARAFDHLVAVRDGKKSEIESHYAHIVRDIEAMAANPFVRDAFLELDTATDAAGRRNLRGADLLEDPQYKLLYDKHIVPLREYARQYGYEDILLLCPEHGHVSFTLVESEDLGQVAAGVSPDSALTAVWRQAVAETGTALSDMRSYGPAGGAPSQFIASPIQEDGQVIGVLAFRIPSTRVNSIMDARADLGETGEAYLVGKDKLMRSDSRLDPEHRTVTASFSDPSAGSVDTEAVDAALSGETGAKILSDYRGVRVLSAYTPVDLFGNRWALVAEIDETDAFAAIEQVRQIHGSTIRSLAAWASGLSVLCLVAIVLVGLGVHWRIAGPIRRMAHAAIAVAKGDLGARVPAEGKSETDVLARAMNRMTANLNEIVEQISAAAVKMESASAEQAAGAASQSAATSQVSSTATELLAAARQMTDGGASASGQAGLATEECSSGTQSIHSAVQGIEGIRERVERIAEHMLGLGSKSQQISGVLDIINELSEQTNLLSLNASIEAAGAGEAGKRFAVVASEIRKLAERAAESTTEIRALVNSIQETVNTTIVATEEGTKAVERGVSLTGDVQGCFERIAGQVASTAQSAKAIEMASRQQATAIEQIGVAVRDIDTTAQQSEATARQMQTEVQTLAEAARRFLIAGRPDGTRAD